MSYEQRPGDYRVQCDYSGFNAWASECVKTWNGFFVLRRFAGEETRRHPQDMVRGRAENTRAPIARPVPTDTFLSVNQVTKDTL